MKSIKNNFKTIVENIAMWLFIVVSISFVMYSGFNVGMKFSDSVIPNNDNSCSCEKDDDDSIITEKRLSELLAIAGIQADGKNIDYEVIFLNGNSLVASVSPKSKAYMIYKYAEYNHLLEIITGDVYPTCKNILGYCQAISVDNYNKIAKLYGITDDPNTMYEPNMIFNNHYLYVYNKPAQVATYTHNYSARYDNNKDIIITDNVQGVTISDKKSITREVTYRFKLNEKGNYYLYGVSSK